LDLASNGAMKPRMLVQVPEPEIVAIDCRVLYVT
jgi:hypothetical protein